MQGRDSTQAATGGGPLAVGLVEFDLVRGVEVGRLRQVIGRLDAEGAVLGLSSSVLGTLAPMAMPGGFGPLGPAQPDLLVSLEAPLRLVAGAVAAVRALLAPLASATRVVAGVPTLHRSEPLPRFPAGPGAGSTYALVTVGGPADGAAVVVAGEGGSAPTALRYLADLSDLPAWARAGEPQVAHAGLYLVPGPALVASIRSP